ncbi:MAG: hypothetical protein MJ059_07745 [Lachnospiraceae bacterium]|nr:hypothetical protein [Lachnospiraceae bacterium]
MVTVSKEYRAMDIADVEEAVSRMVGRKVTVGEMDVTLNDNVLIDWMFEKKPEYSMDCLIEVEGDCVLSEDDDGNDIGPLDEMLPQGEAFVDEKYIFNFDTKLFRSYKREISNDD